MTRADLTVIALSILLLPVLYVQLWHGGEHATHAHITDPDKHLTIASLDQSQSIDIKGELGKSVFEIKDRQIRFSDSACKTKYCVHRGWMQYAGETMACLPNKVVVTLTGGQRKYDSINF